MFNNSWKTIAAGLALTVESVAQSAQASTPTPTPHLEGDPFAFYVSMGILVATGAACVIGCGLKIHTLMTARNASLRPSLPGATYYGTDNHPVNESNSYQETGTIVDIHEEENQGTRNVMGYGSTNR